MFGLIRVRRVGVLKWAMVALVLTSLVAIPNPNPIQAETVIPLGTQDAYPVTINLTIPASSLGVATATGTLGANKLVGVVAAPGGTANLTTQTSINVSGSATLPVPCVGWIKVTGSVVISGVVPITIQDGTAPSSSVFASGTVQLSSANYFVPSVGTQVTIPVQGTATIQATLNNVSVNPGKTFAVVYNPSARTLSGAGGASFTGTGNPFMPMRCRSYLPQLTQTSARYYDDFSNSGSGWPTGEDEDGKCKGEYKDGKYRITVKDDNTFCMIPGYPVPRKAGGTFSVKIQRRSEDDRPVWSGMWFGQLGSDAKQNRWEAIIRSDPSTCEGETRGVLWLSAIVNGSTQLFEDECTSSIDLDKDDTNLLRIVRGNGRVQVYVNNQLVTDVADNWLAGDGYFGLVAISGSQVPVIIDFDDFTVE